MKLTAPNIEIDENTVLRQLKRLNTRKGAGPDGLIPKVIRLCSNQLAATITKTVLVINRETFNTNSLEISNYKTTTQSQHPISAKRL